VDDPDGTGEHEYSEIADSQTQARGATVDAVLGFCALNRAAGSVLDQAELALIAKGTRK
jgi:hypothetical protein